MKRTETGKLLKDTMHVFNSPLLCSIPSSTIAALVQNLAKGIWVISECHAQRSTSLRRSLKKSFVCAVLEYDRACLVPLSSFPLLIFSLGGSFRII